MVLDHNTYAESWTDVITKATPLFKDYYEKEKEFFLKIDLAGKTVLDVGCGEGRFTNLLAKKSKEVVGIDINESELEVAKKANADLKNVTFFHENCLKMHFADSFFDYVFAPDLIANLADKKVSAIKEMVRVAKQNGKIFITAYSENALADRIKSYIAAKVPYHIIDEKKGFVLLDLGADVLNHPSEQFSKQDLMELCQQAGQTKVTVQPLNKIAYVCVIDVQK